jgi:adenine-specific DNA-methyltransferase
LAAIDDLIAQIEDVALRDRLREELKRLTKEKKFGLVFEEHLPELTPVYSAGIRQGSLVARRNGPITETWRVVTINGETAYCYNAANGDQKEIALADLVVVRSFGEPIFPALTPIDRVQNGPDNAPWHTLIEADNYHALQLLEYSYAGRVDCIYIDPPYNTGSRDWKYNNNYVDINDRWRHSKWLAMMKRRLLLGFRLLKPTGIMVVTIDDNEFHRLRSLIEDNIKDVTILGVVAIRNTPQGRSTTRGFAVSHEYAIFIGRSESSEIGRIERNKKQIARYNNSDEKGSFQWVNFRKPGGLFTYRIARPKSYYPIYIRGKSFRIPKMLWDKEKRDWEILENPDPDEKILWPIDDNKEELFGAGVKKRQEKIYRSLVYAVIKIEI